MRLCADEAAAAVEATSGARPLSVGEIVTNFGEEMREVLLARYGLPPEVLAERYAEVRDRWIAEDGEGWIEAHTFHAEAVDALRECVAQQDASVYIYTTKPKRCVRMPSIGGPRSHPIRTEAAACSCQAYARAAFACALPVGAWSDVISALPKARARARGDCLIRAAPSVRRFARALLQHLRIDLDASRVFGLEDGPKTDVLQRLRERHPAEQVRAFSRWWAVVGVSPGAAHAHSSLPLPRSVRLAVDGGRRQCGSAARPCGRYALLLRPAVVRCVGLLDAAATGAHRDDAARQDPRERR